MRPVVVDPDELFRRWGGYIRVLARRWHGYACPIDRTAFAPADLMQEIALAAFRRLPRHDQRKVPFNVWLCGVARSVAGNLRKRALRQKRAGAAFGSTCADGSDRFAAVADPRAADPAAVEQLRDVLVPICDLGLGTGSAWVEDARTGARHRIAGAKLVLADEALCVAAVAFDEAEGLARVLLPNEVTAWVRSCEPPGGKG